MKPGLLVIPGPIHRQDRLKSEAPGHLPPHRNNQGPQPLSGSITTFFRLIWNPCWLWRLQGTPCGPVPCRAMNMLSTRAGAADTVLLYLSPLPSSVTGDRPQNAPVTLSGAFHHFRTLTVQHMHLKTKIGDSPLTPVVKTVCGCQSRVQSLSGP